MANSGKKGVFDKFPRIQYDSPNNLHFIENQKSTQINFEEVPSQASQIQSRNLTNRHLNESMRQ